MGDCLHGDDSRYTAYDVWCFGIIMNNLLHMLHIFHRYGDNIRLPDFTKRGGLSQVNSPRRRSY
jgi:hypothetical protein